MMSNRRGFVLGIVVLVAGWILQRLAPIPYVAIVLVVLVGIVYFKKINVVYYALGFLTLYVALLIIYNSVPGLRPPLPPLA